LDAARARPLAGKLARDGGDAGPDALPELRVSPTQALLVFLAGGAGALLRVVVTPWVDARAAAWPAAGLWTVNVLGCVIAGAAITTLPPWWRVVVVGGFAGGLTTYSAFAVATWELGRARGDVAALWVVGHVLAALAAVALGGALARVTLGNATEPTPPPQREDATRSAGEPRTPPPG
jgi:CrcB protein